MLEKERVGKIKSAFLLIKMNKVIYINIKICLKGNSIYKKVPFLEVLFTKRVGGPMKNT